MLAKVEAILLAMCPDLPRPVTTTLPLVLRISSQTESKVSSILDVRAETASVSIDMVRSAAF